MRLRKIRSQGLAHVLAAMDRELGARGLSSFDRYHCLMQSTVPQGA